MAIDFKDLGKLKWYYQLLLTVLVCGGLLALVWYQFLAPIQQEIQTKTAQIDELQKTIAKSLLMKQDLEKIKKEAMDLEARLDTLKMALPLEKETDQIFRSVQAEAMNSGLKVNRVAPRANPIDHEVYLEYLIDLEIVGTYHNIGLFLDRIRQLPRIVYISGLRLQGRASEGEASFTSSVGATYTATTFVYKEEGVASSAPPPKPVK
jgi:type IV pilus assembly protein PilO